MKIVLPGGSGQIGGVLAAHFHEAGHTPVILSRRPATNPNTRTVVWDAATPGDWTREIDGADAVINLAGRSVNCRYHRRNRESILQSRIRSTQAIGEAIRNAARPPRVWLQSSTATIYAHRLDAPNDEETGRLGNGPNEPETWRFSYDVARSWEAEARKFESTGTRLVLLRSALVCSPDRGGVFDVLLGLVRRGLGGRQGDGRQFVSWIHDRDFVRAIDFLLAEHADREPLTGPVNLASPNPLPNAEFMAAIREAAGAKLGLPATRWMLELGAFFMRTETELVLKSRRVVPTRLLRAGFEFEFPSWPEAAGDLVARWSARRVQ